MKTASNRYLFSNVLRRGRRDGSEASSRGPQMQTVPTGSADLNPTLLQIQQRPVSASVNIGKLRIEKWKTDSQQRQQMQQVGESLQKNIANAVPD